MKKIVIRVIPLLMISSFSVQGTTITSGVYVGDPLLGVQTTNPSHYPQINTAFPVVGAAIIEPSFGLNLTRLTNTGSVGSRHEYSRFDPYNKDQSMILLNHSKVYNTTSGGSYNVPGNEVTTLGITEARWDRSDKNKLWGLSGSSIKTVDLSLNTPAVTVIKNFSSESSLISKLGNDFTITMKGEGESSYSNSHWAFLAKSNATSGSFKDEQLIFTWNKDTNEIHTTELSKRERDNIDWVGMSPNGDYVLIGSNDYNNPNAGEIIGLAMAKKDFSNFTVGLDSGKKYHRLNYDTAHSDVSLDSNGNEVIIMQNSRTDFIDLIPIDPNTKSINEVPLSTDPDPYLGSSRTKLVNLNYSSSAGGFDGGVHISGNHDGYALISTTIGPELAEDNWLEKVILLVSLDDGTAEYLSKTYNTTDHWVDGNNNGIVDVNEIKSRYWQETQATITNDGTKVLWAANGDNTNLSPLDHDYNNFLLQVEVAPVPIPGALLLMGSGLLGLAGISRRRKT